MNGAVGPKQESLPAAPRTARGHALALLLPLLLALVTGCAHGPKMLPRTEQHNVDRALVEYPANLDLRPYIRNLTGPTAFAFDADRNILIAEGGLGGHDPKIYGFKPDGTRFDIYPLGPQYLSIGSNRFKLYGPIGGMLVHHGRIYVSHRDKDDFGVITALDYNGGHRTVISGLPAQGECGVTQMAIDPRSGRLFFGVGTATNSGVVGLDDWKTWVGDHPDVCDKLGRDNVRLTGRRFDTPNPAASWFDSDIAVTGALQRFNASNQTLIRKGGEKPNGAIYSVPIDGGPHKVEATGIHNPRGLAFSEYGLYFTNDGMELRGTRPIKDDPDALLRWVPGTHYGWPDYSTDLQPITLPRFQPPLDMVIRTGYPDVDFLVNHDASQLMAPTPNVLLQGAFPSQSGAAGVTFVPDSEPFRIFQGNAIVALSGDRAPFATSGMKLLGPVGYKVARVDVDRNQVRDFIRNTQGLPASRLKSNPDLLERPVDVKFGPDGALYVLDMGRMTVKDGHEYVEKRTGQIFRLVSPSAPTTRDAP